MCKKSYYFNPKAPIPFAIFAALPLSVLSLFWNTDYFRNLVTTGIYLNIFSPIFFLRLDLLHNLPLLQMHIWKETLSELMQMHENEIL